MEDKKREDIRKIVAEFRGKPVNQKVLASYCERNKMEVVAEGDYKDYVAQVESDEMVAGLFPEILTALQGLTYVPEFATKKERAQASSNNGEVRIKVAQLLEKHAVPYRMLDPITKELAEHTGQAISSAGVTIGNKAAGVLLHIAEKKFGGNFNCKNVADYAEEVYNEAHAKVEEKKEVEPAEPKSAE